jgi:hypothetical protein
MAKTQGQQVQQALECVEPNSAIALLEPLAKEHPLLEQAAADHLVTLNPVLPLPLQLNSKMYITEPRN